MSVEIPSFLPARICLAGLSFTDVRRYTFADALHGIPEMTVEVFGRDPDLDMAALVGERATIELQEPALPRFEGIVRQVDQRALDVGSASVFCLTVVPPASLLRNRSGHRIFQGRTAVEIAEDVLAPYGDAMERPASVVFQRKLPTHEYRVQCGETDHDFLFRLLAEDGLVSLWAPDGTGERQWMVTDDTTAGSVDMEVPYRPASGALGETRPHVTAATVSSRLCSSEIRLRDYDYRKPAFALDQSRKGAGVPGPEGPLVRYGFAVGRFEDPQTGDMLAERRLEEARLKSRTYRWETSFALRAGMKIRLCDHPRDDANGEFLVVSAWSEVELGERRHSAEVIPAGCRWRPEIPPKPRIFGTQTAFVVADAPGKEIDVDAEGRIAVRFHWDIRKDGASRRVRVAMPWAGPGRGFWTVPRVGDEVVIDHLDGDPDQPIVVGSVNNARAPTAQPLPEQQTRSWWVSRTTPGGAGYNFIVMDDAQGKELLAFRAERDLHTETGRDSSAKIGGSAALSVVQGHSVEVGGDAKTTVEGKCELRAGNVEIHSKGDINFNANGARNDSSEMFHYFSAPFIYVVGRNEVEISAQDKITLSVGGASITIESGKITLSAALIDLNP